jgi:hypothetical protein
MSPIDRLGGAGEVVVAIGRLGVASGIGGGGRSSGSALAAGPPKSSGGGRQERVPPRMNSAPTRLCLRVCQQHRQLDDVDRDPPRLIAREQISRRPPARLILD